MDKARLLKVIDKASVETITIPSTASRSDRDRLVKEFVRKASRDHDGEVVLVVVRS
jgi:hypothetical protein